MILLKFKINKKRTQVIRSNLSPMDEVQNAHQTHVHFSTIIRKIKPIQTMSQKFYRGYYYVQRRK
jgi:hypothetical protein